MWSINVLSAASEADLQMQLLSIIPVLFGTHWSVEIEWYVVPGHSQFGVGDFLLEDGHGSFIVIETKCFSHDTGATTRKSRNKKRNHVCYQARYYASQIWQTRNPTSVQAWIFTNDPQRPGLYRLE